MLSACSEFRACLMETWGCCKTLMMGYISMNPKLCLCTWLLETLMLGCDIDPKLCLCAWLLGRAQFKPWGGRKDSVPYMTEVVLTNVLINIDKH